MLLLLVAVASSTVYGDLKALYAVLLPHAVLLNGGISNTDHIQYR